MKFKILKKLNYKKIIALSITSIVFLMSSSFAAIFTKLPSANCWNPSKVSFAEFAKDNRISISNNITYRLIDSFAFIQQIDKNATILTVPKTIKDNDGKIYEVVLPDEFLKDSKIEILKLPQDGVLIYNGYGKVFYGACYLKKIENFDKIKEYLTRLTEFDQEKFEEVFIKFEKNAFKFLYANMFAWLQNLESIVIGSNIIEINRKCFYHCKNLNTVEFAKNSNLNTINEGAFAYCKKLENLSFPEHIEKIKKFAFFGCNNLKELKIPEKTKYSNFSFPENTIVNNKTITYNEKVKKAVDDATDLFKKIKIENPDLMARRIDLNYYQKNHSEGMPYPEHCLINDVHDLIMKYVNPNNNKIKCVSDEEFKKIISDGRNVYYRAIHMSLATKSEQEKFSKLQEKEQIAKLQDNIKQLHNNAKEFREGNPSLQFSCVFNGLYFTKEDWYANMYASMIAWPSIFENPIEPLKEHIKNYKKFIEDCKNEKDQEKLETLNFNFYKTLPCPQTSVIFQTCFDSSKNVKVFYGDVHCEEYTRMYFEENDKTFDNDCLLLFHYVNGESLHKPISRENVSGEELFILSETLTTADTFTNPFSFPLLLLGYDRIDLNKTINGASEQIFLRTDKVIVNEKDYDVTKTF